MLKNVEATRQHVKAELEALRLDVFNQPPSDWAGFQLRLGAYQQLLRLEAALTPDPTPQEKDDELPHQAPRRAY